MGESPLKSNTSSRVIDQLHSEIHGLKAELENTKMAHDNYKKKYEVSNKRNEAFIDQLANAKHENDMIDALLKRKERRIKDLEDQYNEVLSTNESLHLTNKNMKIRCESLQQASVSATADYERLKIAYDALKASQIEYKKHYESEVSALHSQLDQFKQQHLDRYEQLQAKWGSNDKDIDTLLDGLTNKRKTLDNLYFNKNKLIIDLLSKLALVSKTHGQETKSILQNNLDAITLLIAKYPELPIKLKEKEDVDFNIEELLNESSEVISNASFDEGATLVNSPDPNEFKPVTKANPLSNKKRRNTKRNSIRFDKNDNSERTRTLTPPKHNVGHERTEKLKKQFNEFSSTHNNTRNILHNNTSHNSNHSHNHPKGKRWPMYSQNTKRNEEVSN